MQAWSQSYPIENNEVNMALSVDCVSAGTRACVG